MSSTNIDREEERMRSLFHRLRKEQQTRTPDFSSILNRSRHEQQPSRRNLRTLTVVVAGVTIIILIEVYVLRPFQSGEPKQEFLHWESPTAILLQPPESQFLTTVPQLGNPLIRFEKTNPLTSTKEKL